MEENIRIDRKENFDVPMFNKIVIGDPLYFEEGEGLQYTYAKNFRGKNDWVGDLEVVEEVNLDFAKEFGRESSYVSVLAHFAPNEEYLETYKNGQYYKGQKTKAIEIGVDTARYLVEINDRYLEIYTGSDGLMGLITEYYRGNKLEGITISLTGTDVNEFDRFRDEMKYVFGA